MHAGKTVFLPQGKNTQLRQKVVIAKKNIALIRQKSGLLQTIRKIHNGMEEEKSMNQPVNLPGLAHYGVALYMKREDLIHPVVSGNKYRKLKYNLEHARELGAKRLLTFGGAYSNHISALSFAGRMNQMETVGVIRGEELGSRLEEVLRRNPTLGFAASNGMRFHFVTREQYRKRKDPAFLDALDAEYGPFYLVPEGGTNALAVKGCEEILLPGDLEFDYVCAPVGTGGTLAGLVNSMGKHQQGLGFQSLQGDFLQDEIAKYTIPERNWSLIDAYHFGGYAKVNENLISFINEFYRSTTIPLDPVYTGKMMYGIVDLIKKRFFRKNSKILAIHTGGLQGISGMNELLKKKNLPEIWT